MSAIEANEANEASRIAEHCVAAGAPHMIAPLLAEGVSLTEAIARVNVIGAVNAITAIARQKEPSIAIDFGTALLAAGKTVPEIRAALLEQIVAKEDEVVVSSHIPLVNEGMSASMASMASEMRKAGIQPAESPKKVRS